MVRKKGRILSERNSMFMLGGWLFADLLLGLVMLFFTANTVGQPAPTPTPTATPNLLATERANSAALATQAAGNAAVAAATATAAAAAAAQTAESLGQQVAASEQELQTAEARATADAFYRQQLTATANALATRAALSDEARATADAQATADALAAQATIAAFATEQAQSSTDIDAITAERATAAAIATAEAQAAQATIAALATVEASQATQAAELAAIATENALTGANDQATAAAQATAAQATIDALGADQTLSDSELATARAESAAVQATANAVQAQQANLFLTATALATQIAGSAFSGDFAEESVTVDLQGVINNEPGAIADARQEIQQVLEPYRTNGCIIGFVLAAGSSPSEQWVGEGNSVADAVIALISEDYDDVFQGGSTSFAEQAGPAGLVELTLFVNVGCPLGQDAQNNDSQ